MVKVIPITATNRTYFIRGYNDKDCQPYVTDTTGNLREARQIANRMLKAGAKAVNIDTTLVIYVQD